MAAREPVVNDALPEQARALLDVWFGVPGDPLREQHREIWFKSTPEHDAMLRDMFLAHYERAAVGELSDWEDTPASALALVLLLDQIPRNIFRGDARTYATDVLARDVAERAMAKGFDRELPHHWRKFFYMPLHHSENLADQLRAAELVAALPHDGVPEDRDRRGGLRRYGIPYPEVIARFGRFPHRNRILGRESTPEELAFLARREPEHEG